MEEILIVLALMIQVSAKEGGQILYRVAAFVANALQGILCKLCRRQVHDPLIRRRFNKPYR